MSLGLAIILLILLAEQPEYKQRFVLLLSSYLVITMLLAQVRATIT